MAYRIAVIDDNPTDIEYVTTLVRVWADRNNESAVGNLNAQPMTTINIEPFPSAEAFLFIYAEDKAWDILLLDIEMGDMNGVELAKAIRRENEMVQMVFITGFPDFISEGYEVSALHYLMKPVSPEKLYAVLDKAAANLAKAEKQLRITHERQTDFVPLSQILYVEAQKQYVLIHTVGETFRMKCSLAEMEGQLDEYFLKCQRSFVVNLRHVKRIQSANVVLKDGESVPISRGMAEKIGKEMIRLF